MKKMMAGLKGLIAAGACVFAGTTTSAAVLQIDKGDKLIGATGVIVNGVSYDVSFVEGTCVSVLGSCTQTNFEFKTQQTAQAAGQALLDQVFLDSDLGKYDSITGATFGCTNGVTSCNSLIPFATNGANILTVISSNSDKESDSIFSGQLASNFNTSDSGFYNYARFTLSAADPSVAAVPEPATWAMMILGFGLTGAAMRRPRSRTVRFA